MYNCFQHHVRADLGLRYVYCANIPFPVMLAIFICNCYKRVCLQGSRVQTLSVADKKLHQTERVSEERTAKRSKYYDRQSKESSSSHNSYDIFKVFALYL